MFHEKFRLSWLAEDFFSLSRSTMVDKESYVVI